jgi:hypothetical protein
VAAVPGDVSPTTLKKTVEHELSAFNLYKRSGYSIHTSRFSLRKLYVFATESILEALLFLGINNINLPFL